MVVGAVAVCFLHSYANPLHEQRAAAILREAAPDLFVSTSSEVFQSMREFERWTTTTVNAFTGPMFDRYVARLETGLAEQGFRGRLYIMSSSGGMLTTSTARRFPVRALESGPAAGALMSAAHGRALALDNLLSFDMGGTTAKGALVRAGEPIKKYEMEVARSHEFRRGSGLMVRIPVIDMIEIGAGGGSLAGVDERGLLKVGPESAGADPGPACYGQGGTRPALTDANLALGYLDAGFFLGGKMRLDVAAAERAIAEHVAKPLGVETLRAAFGIHDIISEEVARAFRIHASERAFDYRTSSMVAFGGSGPLHALGVARKLKIPRVVFPVAAGVMSALGLLESPLAFEVARSRRVHVGDLDAAGFAAFFRELEDDAARVLVEAGVRRQDVRIVRRLDMRYQGQGHEIEVALPDAGDAAGLFARLDDLFGDAYARIYTLRLGEPAEIVNWKVEAVAPAAGLGAGYSLAGAEGGPAQQKGTRRAYHPGEQRMTEWPVYDRYALRPGASVAGPALIEERESTCVVGPADRVTVDERLNLVAELDLGAKD
jgi:N-methylhydantoinase A